MASLEKFAFSAVLSCLIYQFLWKVESIESCLVRGMASLERDSSVVFNYLSTSEIWHYKRDGLGGKGFIRRGLL